MAVIVKYAVVRNGVELEMAFADKRAAEAYDRMLDAAEGLARFIKESGPPIDADDALLEAIAVFLAQRGSETIRILKGLKSEGSPPAAAPEASAGGRKPAQAAQSSPRGKSPHP